LRELVIGVGQCGRRIGEALASSLLNVVSPGYEIFNALIDKKRIDGIVLIDLSDFQVPRELDRVRERLSIKQFSLASSVGTGGGAGKNPEVAKKAAESRFADLYNSLLKESTKTVEHINIINSGGGGTGAGAGPVIARKILEEEPELQGEKRDTLLLTSTVILPHEEEDRSNRNAALTLSRYYGYVDGIIVADNSIWKKLQNDIVFNKPMEARDTHSVINEYLSSNLKWMNAADEILINALPFELSKNYESRDFRNLFTRNTPTGIVVPCYEEYDISSLEEFSIFTLILHTISTSALVDVDFNKPFESLIVFIGIPNILRRGLGRFQSLSKAVLSVGELQLLLRNYLKMPSKNPIDIVYIYSTALSNRVTISIWIVNPYVEKLAVMADLVFKTAEREKKSEEVERLHEAGYKLAQLIPYSEEANIGENKKRGER
jgi:hypothetical protein